jgi:hypothetical protein
LAERKPTLRQSKPLSGVAMQFAQKQPHPLSFRSQIYRRGICLVASSEAADSSRDKAALRNDKFVWDFKIAPTPGEQKACLPFTLSLL